jgi:hypothetical protein
MLPKLLVICGRTWTVEFKKQVIDDDGKTVHGTCDGDKNSIEIACDKTADDNIRSSLLHEFLHASIKTILNRYPDDEDSLVTGLEAALYNVYRHPSNKWFWSKLAEGSYLEDNLTDGKKEDYKKARVRPRTGGPRKKGTKRSKR